jgi:hypothetical protein
MTMFRCIEAHAFTGRDGGATHLTDDIMVRVITVGTLMDDRDPNFRAQFFEPVETAAARPALRAAGVMEDASAAPNAKRRMGRPRG